MTNRSWSRRVSHVKSLGGGPYIVEATSTREIALLLLPGERIAAPGRLAGTVEVSHAQGKATMSRADPVVDRPSADTVTFMVLVVCGRVSRGGLIK